MAVHSEPTPYPLLSEILTLRQMTIQPTYTIRDVARMFGVSTRAIQARVAAGQPATRDLPGRAKFLSCDLEKYIRESVRGGAK